MSLAVDQPFWLLLAPLALLPLLVRSERPLVYPGLALIPKDALSTAITVLARVLGAALVLSLVIALAGPHRPARTEQRVGRGAEVVLLLDRSASMDQSFAGQHLDRSLTLGNLRTKGEMANALLGDFVASRANDMVGMVVFSTAPLQTLPLSRQPALMQAAIRAAGIGRGLARTQVGDGLEHALSMFEDRPYQGSRIVMLISDGAARLGAAARTRIRNAARRNRVTLYWLYLRSRGSPGIDDTGERPVTPNDYPEQALHRFFGRIGIPYRFYDAEDPGALQAAIDDVNHQQKLPIRYQEQVPRVELSGSFYWLALGLLLPLAALRATETRAWR
jgi:mxaC protein